MLIALSCVSLFALVPLIAACDTISCTQPKGLLRSSPDLMRGPALKDVRLEGWLGAKMDRFISRRLVDPFVRGSFGKDGKLRDQADERGISLGSYAKAMQELSVELKAEFVDMNRLTHDLLEKVGKDESMKFFVISTGLVKSKDGEPAKDVTHPIAAGAEAFAKLFIDDVKARNLEVATLFK